MSHFSIEELKWWNHQGLIPGPEETERDFAKRAQFCVHLEQELKHRGSELPFETNDEGAKEILHEAYPKTTELYDIAPVWIPIFLNNYQLSPWQGGCAWIFQLTEDTPTAAFLQLRAQFRFQQAYLGLYQRHELVAHELSHVGRMMFHEPRFEEILAYRSSSSPWRRWFGPIIQSSTESLFFILLLSLIVLINFAFIALGNGLIYQWALWLNWVPVGLVGIALGRLGWRQWIFNRCLNQLQKTYKNSSLAKHVIYRLTDDEIRSFAFLTPEKIKAFIQSKVETSFRWQFIVTNYPSILE